MLAVPVPHKNFQANCKVGMSGGNSSLDLISQNRRRSGTACCYRIKMFQANCKVAINGMHSSLVGGTMGQFENAVPLSHKNISGEF